MDRWKLTAVGGWALAGVMLLTGADDRGEVRARRLVLEDEKGVERIVMVTIDNQPVITLYDPENRGRLTIGLKSSGAPTVLLMDETNKTRASLGLAVSGYPVLRMIEK